MTERVIQRIEDTGSQNVLALGSATLLTFRVPSGCTLRLTHFANYVGNTAAWGSISWTAYRNGVMIPELANILDQIGEPSDPRSLVGGYELTGGSTLTIVASNSSSTTAYAAGAAYKADLISR